MVPRAEQGPLREVRPHSRLYRCHPRDEHEGRYLFHGYTPSPFTIRASPARLVGPTKFPSDTRWRLPGPIYFSRARSSLAQLRPARAGQAGGLCRACCPHRSRRRRSRSFWKRWRQPSLPTLPTGFSAPRVCRTPTFPSTRRSVRRVAVDDRAATPPRDGHPPGGAFPVLSGCQDCERK